MKYFIVIFCVIIFSCTVEGQYRYRPVRNVNNGIYWQQQAQLQYQAWYLGELQRINTQLIIAQRQAQLRNLDLKCKLIKAELNRANDFILSQALKHPDIIYRLTAIQVISENNQLGHASGLIERLSDPSIEVQQMARSILIKFYNQDYGPLPGVSGTSLSESINAWRQCVK